jgi:putative flippase GtrA
VVNSTTTERIGRAIRPTGLKYVKFLVAAGASVPVNLGSRVLFSMVVPFAVAIVVSQIVGMLVAYGLTRTFVFESTRSSWTGELARFAAVNVFSLAQMWLVSMTTLYVLLPALGYHFHNES